MKLSISIPALFIALLPASAAASIEADQSQLLTGDTRLACEATLCLSSNERPNECAPSLKRFFSIRHKTWHKTLKARKDFLKLCPSSNENDGMRRLTDAIAEGAGRCDAAELNRVMRSSYTGKKCYYRSNKAGGSYCAEQKISYIRNAKPSYCSAYFDHEWTVVGDSVRYVGEEKKNGRWVDVK